MSTDHVAANQPAGQPAGHLADRRIEYRHAGLDRTDLHDDPFTQFANWIDAAIAACEGATEEPHAMTLATVGADHRPSVRTVLLKGFDQRGFVWFTNYGSRKAQEIESSGVAALNFRWSPLERQVNVIGTVRRVTNDESDAYFLSRPRGSRIGAMVSPQSQVIESRAVLEHAAEQLAARADVDDSVLARPENWGGFRLVPEEIEFWQGRPSRLHDRFRYRRADRNSRWAIDRLAP